MPSDRRIRVMISSRCKSKVKLGGKIVQLSDLRGKMKESIESYKPFGEPFFECWINEDETESASEDFWAICRDEVRWADILLVLYNGDPGFTGGPDGLGICHAELMAGLESSPHKVFLICLPVVDLPAKGHPDRAAHENFRAYFDRQALFGRQAADGDQVLAVLPDTLHGAVTTLTQMGVRAGGRRSYNTGDALAWNRMDYSARKLAMEKTVREVLALRPAAQVSGDLVFARVHTTDMLFCVHAIPGPISTPAARELVGRPFYRDHGFEALLSSRKGNCGGPLHVIACHRSVTEKQAADLLGQPDIYTVDGDFGVLAIDRVGKAQCLFLRNCRDVSMTQYAVQRAFDWMARSGEDREIARNGQARRRILAAIAKEI